MGVKNIIGELRVNGVPIGPSVGLKFVSNGDGTCFVDGIGDCTDIKITIPEVSPSGDAVIGIGNKAFDKCNDLTSITLPDSVTYIGTYALRECWRLTNVIIGNGVTSIEREAFADCGDLTSIIIPNNVTNVQGDLFRDCRNLTIYCEAEKKPDGWASDWNSDCPVVWGYVDFNKVKENYITKDNIGDGLTFSEDGDLQVDFDISSGLGENSLQQPNANAYGNDSAAMGTSSAGTMVTPITYTNNGNGTITLTFTDEVIDEQAEEIFNAIRTTDPYNNESGGSPDMARRLHFHLIDDTSVDLVYYRAGYLQGSYTDKEGNAILGYQDESKWAEWWNSENRSITLTATTNTQTYEEAMNGKKETEESALYMVIERYPSIGSVASGGYAFAAGEGAVAGGFYSSALGRDTQALHNAGIAIGHTSKTSGKYGIALGVYTEAHASSSVAIGRSAKVSFGATFGLALGRDASSQAENAVAIRGVAKAKNAIAIGGTATGEKSLALIGGTASGKLSFAFNNGKASAKNSIAIGGQAKGEGSVAIGFYVDKNGPSPVAEGINSFAIGTGSTTSSAAIHGVAIGYKASAKGESAIALGQGTIANGWQTVVGKYNKELPAPASFGSQGSEEAIFIVGTGRGATASGRKNGFVIWGDGHATIGKAPTSDMDVVNKAYIDNLNIADKVYVDNIEAEIKKYADNIGTTSKDYTDAVKAEMKQYVDTIASPLSKTWIVSSVEPDSDGILAEGTTDSEGTLVVPEKGDILLVSKTSNEYVYDGSKWINFGMASAQETRLATIEETISKQSTKLTKISYITGKTQTVQKQDGTTETTDFMYTQVGGDDAGAHSVGLGRGIKIGPHQTVVGRFNMPVVGPAGATAIYAKPDRAVFIVGTGYSKKPKNSIVAWADGHVSIGPMTETTDNSITVTTDGRITVKNNPVNNLDVATKGYIDAFTGSVKSINVVSTTPTTFEEGVLTIVLED